MAWSFESLKLLTLNGHIAIKLYTTKGGKMVSPNSNNFELCETVSISFGQTPLNFFWKIVRYYY